jgi:hypothetical protein
MNVRKMAIIRRFLFPTESFLWPNYIVEKRSTLAKHMGQKPGALRHWEYFGEHIGNFRTPWLILVHNPLGT